MKSPNIFVAAFIFVLAAHASSQTKWFKYEGNPVLHVGAPGSWDAYSARIDRVIPGDTMKMWYTGSSSGSFPFRIGYATSTDRGVTWTKLPTPVLSPSLSWDAQASFKPYVISSPSGYNMWYTGNSGAYRIGHATSPDGINWTKRPDPVLGAGGSGWWSNGLQHPTVIPDGTGGYKMWMQGSPGLVFGYSVATDETTWTSPTQINLSDNNSVYYQRVIFNGQFYEMWYAFNTSSNVIKYATSPDGINWTIGPVSPVLPRGPAAWDAQWILPGDVHFDGSMYEMWYYGSSGNAGGPYRSGYAVSPKGTTVSVLPTGYVPPGDTVWVAVTVDDTTGLFFFAEIESPKGNPIDSVVLVHVGSSVFTNYWIVPTGSNNYFVDLKLTLRDTLTFEMNNVGTFTTITSVSQESGLPKRYYLDQNYPNPFNPRTTIQFSIPRSEFATLRIFNVLGEQITTLVSENISVGTHQVEWNAHNLPSGVYFYRLQAGAFMATKKLILLR